MFCKKCGSMVDDDSVFCYKCGTKLFLNEKPSCSDDFAGKETISDKCSISNCSDIPVNRKSISNDRSVSNCSDIPANKETIGANCSISNNYENEEPEHIIINNPEIVEFGNYNSVPLEWIVLFKELDKELLICKNIVSLTAYSKQSTGFSLSRSSALKWLNTEFYEKAFSIKERLVISNESLNIKTNNPVFKSDLNDSCLSKFFIFSVEEFNIYLKGNDLEVCSGLNNSDGLWWWLCTPGVSRDFVTTVSPSGKINFYGMPIACDYVGIRPAMWIKR